MEEKKGKPLSTEFIKQFLLEAQHRSGLPRINPLSIAYVQMLSTMTSSSDTVSNAILDSLMDIVINNYMILVHDVHYRDKNWKSYDW